MIARVRAFLALPWLLVAERQKAKAEAGMAYCFPGSYGYEVNKLSAALAEIYRQIGLALAGAQETQP
jgi:hypothetical protein